MIHDGWLRNRGLVFGGARSGRPFDGELNEFVDILGAAAAAAVIHKPELRLELAGQDQPGPPGFTDIRFGDPVAQTNVHRGPL